MRQVSLATVMGVVRVRARYGQDPESKAWVLPLRALLGLAPKQRRSPVLEDRMNFTAVRTGSFQSAAEVAERWGTPVDDSTLQRTVQRVGKRIEARMVQRVEAVMKDEQPAQCVKAKVRGEPPTLILMMDGWMNRERGEQWGLKPAQAPASRVEWREIKGAVLFGVEDRADNGSGRGMLLRKYCVAWRGDPVEFGRRVYAEAMRRGLQKARKVFVVADGAVWIWNLVGEHFSQATGVLDFYHAIQHLHALSQTLFADPDTAKAWREPLIHQLRHGGEARFLKTLDELQNLVGNLEAQSAHAARREIAYFQAHDAHIHYDGIHQQGCPIGSGAVESFCSQMQSRLKGRGRFWTAQGAANLIALDLAIRNGDSELLAA